MRRGKIGMSISKKQPILMALVLLAFGTPFANAKPTAYKDMSAMTSLGADNTITSPLDVGFQADDCLISSTQTLGKPYYLDPNSNTYTNLTNGNNLCESHGDAILNNGTIPLGVVSLWITWDTNNLYGALQGYANGQQNNLFVLLDTVSDKGIDDFLKLDRGWKRDLRFSSMLPDFYLGIWTDYNSGSSLWNTTWSGTNHSGGAGYEFWYIHENGATIDSDPDGKFRPISTDFNNPNRPWAGYTGRGFSDPDHDDNLLFFKIPWKILTNRVTSEYVGLTNWKIKLTAASTGDDVRTGKAVLDMLPDSVFSIEDYNRMGRIPVQKNYIEFRVTDGSGQFILNSDIRTTGKVAFLPGFRTFATIESPSLSRPELSPDMFRETFLANGVATFALQPAIHSDDKAVSYELHLWKNDDPNQYSVYTFKPKDVKREDPRRIGLFLFGFWIFLVFRFTRRSCFFPIFVFLILCMLFTGCDSNNLWEFVNSPGAGYESVIYLQVSGLEAGVPYTAKPVAKDEYGNTSVGGIGFVLFQ